MQLKIDISNSVTPAVQRFLTGLRRKTGLHRMMGNRVQALTRDHLIQISRERHATAKRLGASPSGFWGKAAEKVARPQALQSDESGGALTIKHPGISQAFQDVVIRPTGGRNWLTLPLIAQAYNRRAYRIPGLFRPLRKGAKQRGYRFSASGRRVPIYSEQDRMRVLSKRTSSGLQHWYALVRSVKKRQDRSLLPTDQQFSQACKDGILDYIRLLRSSAGRKGGGV